jgi:hypothetical protein
MPDLPVARHSLPGQVMGFRSSKKSLLISIYKLNIIHHEYIYILFQVFPMHLKRFYFSPLMLSVITTVMMLHGCNRSSQDLNSSNSTKPATMNYIETFQTDVCDRILLEYYNKLSDERDNIAPYKQAVLTDPDTIKKIITLMHALPDKGDMMVKMGNVPVLKVTLIYKDKAVFFKYYENSVQTPATSFYSTPPQEEKLLFELLMAAVNV